MAGFSGKFESNKQNYETPDNIFDPLNKIFNFTTDVCADEINAKCKIFYSEKDSCLDKEWSGSCWMNPPFKNMKNFIIKAYEQRFNATTVCLIPARTNTNWWHEYCMKGEIILIKGRPKFKGCDYGLPQPLALIVFGEDVNCGYTKTFDLKNGEIY